MAHWVPTRWFGQFEHPIQHITIFSNGENTFRLMAYEASSLPRLWHSYDVEPCHDPSKKSERWTLTEVCEPSPARGTGSVQHVFSPYYNGSRYLLSVCQEEKKGGGNSSFVAVDVYVLKGMIAVGVVNEIVFLRRTVLEGVMSAECACLVGDVVAAERTLLVYEEEAGIVLSFDLRGIVEDHGSQHTASPRPKSWHIGSGYSQFVSVSNDEADVTAFSEFTRCSTTLGGVDAENPALVSWPSECHRLVHLHTGDLIPYFPGEGPILTTGSTPSKLLHSLLRMPKHSALASESWTHILALRGSSREYHVLGVHATTGRFMIATATEYNGKNRNTPLTASTPRTSSKKETLWERVSRMVRECPPATTTRETQYATIVNYLIDEEGVSQKLGQCVTAWGDGARDGAEHQQQHHHSTRRMSWRCNSRSSSTAALDRAQSPRCVELLEYVEGRRVEAATRVAAMTPAELDQAQQRIMRPLRRPESQPQQHQPTVPPLPIEKTNGIVSRLYEKDMQHRERAFKETQRKLYAADDANNMKPKKFKCEGDLHLFVNKLHHATPMRGDMLAAKKLNKHKPNAAAGIPRPPSSASDRNRRLFYGPTVKKQQEMDKLRRMYSPVFESPRRMRKEEWDVVTERLYPSPPPSIRSKSRGGQKK